MSATPPETAGPAVRWARAIAEPALALQWDRAQWNRIVHLARRLRLLARLGESLERAGLLGDVPPQARQHLLADMRLSRWHTTNQVWLIECVGHMLREARYPLVLLKGSAYVGQDLPIAPGRLPSDVDILVPPAALDEARRRLRSCGWVEAALDDHDRRYYLEWSHEAPPMRHPAHGLELDLHHGILPPVGHAPVDTALLLDRLQSSKWPRWSVLDPVDQVMHSAAHLFFDSDLRDRLRDLVDLDGLLRHFGATVPGFWQALPERASALGLGEPLALTLWLCSDWLGTPMPTDAAQAARSSTAAAMPTWWTRQALRTVLQPLDHGARDSAARAAAEKALLVRYHWRRMPLRLLVPHLWRKTVKRSALGRRAPHEADI